MYYCDFLSVHVLVGVFYKPSQILTLLQNRSKTPWELAFPNRFFLRGQTPPFNVYYRFFYELLFITGNPKSQIQNPKSKIQNHDKKITI